MNGYRERLYSLDPSVQNNASGVFGGTGVQFTVGDEGGFTTTGSKGYEDKILQQ